MPKPAPDPWSAIERRHDGPVPGGEGPDPGRRRLLFAGHAALAAEVAALARAHAEAGRRLRAAEASLDLLWQAIAAPGP